MLYSAKYNFIYSKSIKTASTSAEAALEYLIRGEIGPHYTDSMMYPDGSRIGRRGRNNVKNDPHFNTPAFVKHHASLGKIRALIGADAFDAATKISSIRNPYDRCVSAFHFKGKKDLGECMRMKEEGQLDVLKQQFADYLSGDDYDGRGHFCFRSKMVIDHFIRMEEFAGDLRGVLGALKVPADVSTRITSSMPEFKKTDRSSSGLLLRDYYSEPTLELVNRRFADWFVWGNYSRCQSVHDLG